MRLLSLIILAALFLAWPAVGPGRPVLAQPSAATDGAAPVEAQAEIHLLESILTRAESTAANREDAAQLLLKKQTPEAVAVLIAELQKSDRPAVPVAILNAIAVQRSPESSLLLVLFQLAAAENLPAPLQESLPAALGAYRDKGIVDQLLVRQADSKLLSERLLLINALGCTGEKAAAAPLIELLRSEEPTLRAAAVKALMAITLTAGFGESYEKWQTWWHEHKYESRDKWLADRLRALEALAERQTEAVTRLTQRLVETYQANLLALATRERAEQLVKLLDDALPELRALAAGEAQKLFTEGKAGESAPALNDKLLGHVTDSSPVVRTRATLALAAGQDKRAAGALLKRLNEEGELPVRMAIVDALGELREPQAVPVLVWLVEGKDESLAVRAATALGQIGERGTPAAEAIGPALIPLSDALLHYGETPAVHQSLREAAARALFKIGRPEVVPTLIKALDDEAIIVRFFAARALGNIGQESRPAIEALLKHLTDADKGVRTAVADTLGKLGDAAVGRVVADRLAPGGEAEAEVRSTLWNALIAIEKRCPDAREIEALADEFAAGADQAGVVGAVQLYEVAIAKLNGTSGASSNAEADRQLDELRLKMSDAYVKAGQASKAVAVIRDLLKKAAGEAPRAALEQRLGKVLLTVPPHVEGAELLAKAAATARPVERQELLTAIYNQSRQLLTDNKVAEAFAVLARGRELLTEKWAESPDAARMELLLAEAGQALFERSLRNLSATDAEVRQKAQDEASRAARLAPELLWRQLQSALDGGSQTVPGLEKLLPAVRSDLADYRAAQTPQEKIEVIKSWRASPAVVPATAATATPAVTVPATGPATVPMTAVSPVSVTNESAASGGSRGAADHE